MSEDVTIRDRREARAEALSRLREAYAQIEAAYTSGHLDTLPFVLIDLGAVKAIVSDEL